MKITSTTTRRFALILFAGLTAACSNNTPPAANEVLKPATSATALPTIAANQSKIKTADGTGIVTKINLEIGSVGLDHDEIKGIMPAMEGMEFYVSDKKMLDQLKVGDKVDFVLEDNAGAERIISIKKSK